MNLEELRRIRERERSTDSPQSLREEFYDDVAAYLAELREERDRLADETEDPFQDPAVRRISDELATAERTVEALYERRIGKIVKLASFAAADMSANHDGLTPEERLVFDDIVETIKTSRTAVFEQLREGDRPVDEERESFKRGQEATDVGPETDDRESSEEESPASRSDVERLTVRIKEDIGTIVGVDDRSYKLSKDDIVSLPRQNADPLVQREVAETIK